MSRRKTVLLVLGVLLGALVASVLIRFLAASREELDTTVRVDGFSELGDGRYLVQPLGAPVQAQELEIQAITRYPFGYAVVEPKEGHDPLRPAARPTAVRTREVRRERHARVVLAYGKLAAVRDARLAVETSGRVLTYAVPVGAHVKAGDALLELNPEDAQLRLETAQADLEVADGQLARATTHLATQRQLLGSAKERLDARAAERERWIDLAAQSVASRDRADAADEVWRLALAAYEQLEGALNLASAEVTAAEASRERAAVALKVAVRDREHCTLRAPYPGEVGERLVGVGDFVTPGTPVVRLVDQSRIRVRLHVRPGEALWLERGASATVRIPSLLATQAGDAPTHGTGSGPLACVGQIEGVSAISDPQTQKIAVDVVVENPGTLRAGLFARVELDGGAVEGAVWIPDTAVVAGETSSSVYLLEGDVARRQVVELGARLGEGRLLVGELGGAGPWELVIDGTALLYDGATVRRVE